MTRAALFDMDRTLVRKDTATLYIRYMKRMGHNSTLDVMRVAWWMAQYTLGVLDAPAVAERAAGSVKGTTVDEFRRICDDWFSSDVLPHVTDAGRRAVEAHRAAGDHLAIVTGATQFAAGPLARELDIEHVIHTTLEDQDGVLTGGMKKPMPYGEGKITLTQQLAEQVGFSLEDAIFYTDSITDRPLLEAVGEQVIVNPDARLRRLAAQRRWRIERW